MALNIGPMGRAPEPTPEAPRIYDDSYKHSIVDSKYQPEMSLLTQVTGIPRLTEYYRQYLNESEEPIPFQPNDMATYQSYTRIKNLVIKEEGDGAYNFNPENGESGQNYTAYVIFDLTPILGDVFIADIGDGNAGLFILTEQPELKNFTGNKVYLITYVLQCIVTNELFQELDKRVVDEKVYSRDSAIKGGNAVITTDVYEVEQKLVKWGLTIGNYLLSTFYWNPEKTVALVDDVNEPTRKTYDPGLVNFLSAVLPPDLRNLHPPFMKFSTQYGGKDYGYHHNINVWDVLLRGDWNLLQICSNKAWLIDVHRLPATRVYGNISNSKFDLVIVTDEENFKTYQLTYYNMDGFPLIQYNDDETTTYLFSDGFYKGNPQPGIETLITSALRDRIIDRNALLAYCEDYFKLKKWEQLYYGSILLMLIDLSRKIERVL